MDRTRPGAETLWFGSAGHEAFACLHAGAAGADTGLVICSAFGREELCVHRTLRHIAEGAAERGVPVLRFDYPCTGDSNGDELAPGQVALWTASIAQAIDLLRQRTGVQRVHVLGFRIGALLALHAVRGRLDVAGLVAMAAPASGRAYVRELKMAGLKLVRSEGPADEGLLESGGYAMTADCQRDLSGLGFVAGTLPAGCPVLAMERDDRPREAPWLDELQAAGHAVRRVTLEHYADMMAPSFRGVVPEAALAQLFAWLLTKQAVAAPVRSAAQALDACAAPVAACAGAGAECISAEGDARDEPRHEVDAAPRLVHRHSSGQVVHERAVTVDAALGMVGVLSEPAALPLPATGRPLVLLLPPGADRRLGPGRLYVTLARELAAAGNRVLRLDITGVGDSPARAGCAENAVYQPQALQDVALARSFLRKFPDSGPIRVVGHCSGAYNALKSALTDASVSSIALINPLVFFWKPGMALEDPLGQTNLAAAAMNYRQNVFSLQHWDRILREPRKLLHVINVLLRWPLARVRNGLRDLLRLCGVRLEEDLGRELQALARAGVKVRFFFSTGDPGETLLRLQGGRVVTTLQSKGDLSVERIPGADHDLSFRRDRTLLLQQLKALLGGEPP